MPTRTINSSAGASTNFYGVVGSKYLAQYGLGPQSLYCVLKATSPFDVDGPGGEIMFPDSTYVGMAKPADASGKRGIGGLFPAGDMATLASVVVLCNEYGMPVRCDLADPKVIAMAKGSGGEAAVDAFFFGMAVNNLLQRLQYEWLTALTAGTTPFDAADVDAAAADWDSATPAIAANLEDVFSAGDFGFGFLDSIVWDTKAEGLLRRDSGLQGRGAGATVDAGYLDSVLSSFGISNRYTVPVGSPLGDKVILFHKGQGNALDPQQAPALLLARNHAVAENPLDEWGIEFKMEEVAGSFGRLRDYNAIMNCDPDITLSSGGGRVINVY